MFKCGLCTKTFSYLSELDRHMVTHTKEKPYNCVICSGAFALESRLKNHIKFVHDGIEPTRNKNHHCTMCSYKCGTKSSLQVHMRRHSAERPFSCQITGCGFNTKYKSALSQHALQAHSEKLPFRCPAEGCSYKATTRAYIRKHLIVHSNDKPFACTVPGCSYTSKCKGVLKRHTFRVHSNEKPFKCSVCDFRAKVKWDLTQHQLKHTNIKRFQCQAPNCEYASRQRYNLKVHFDCKHRNKDVLCTEPKCSFKCGSIEILKRHLQRHVKQMLKCPADSCRYSTISKTALTKHISHCHKDVQSAPVVGPRLSDLQTLHCDFPECHFQTKFPHFYDRHRKTHNGEGKRNRVCSFCFSRFRYLYELKAHVQSHVREKPYSCSLCKYTAVYSGNLVKHAKRTHNIHVTPRGKEDEVNNCRICDRICLSYSEFVLHSMSHLQPVVVLEQLNFRVL